MGVLIEFKKRKILTFTYYGLYIRRHKITLTNIIIVYLSSNIYIVFSKQFQLNENHAYCNIYYITIYIIILFTHI
jgi:hypothetical protein